jgi:Zn-dependent peptidase ImmA (M78 family)/transcriptional regulator with XRE-family HTH domain
MVTRIPIVPKVIRWARERNNLTLPEAAKRLKCDQATLEQIEDENAPLRPTATLFRRMAEVYLLPEATLLRAVPPQDGPLPKDFRSFDGVPVDLSYETICALRRVEHRQEALARLAEMDNVILAPNLPIHSLKEKPEQLGANFRKQLGFPVLEQLQFTPERAFTRWRVLVENLGVSVYVEPFGADDTRGSSVFSNAFPAIIIDQNEKFPGAKLFTLFHELCHLLIRQAGISDFKPKNSVEAFCNRFASAFLMPVEAIKAVFDMEKIKAAEPAIDELASAANKLCVTISQLALRLEQLEYTKSGYFKRITSKLTPPTPKKKKPDAKVPYKYVYLSEAGYNFPATVFDSMARGQITELGASRILDLAPNHFKAVRAVIETRRAELVNGEG